MQANPSAAPQSPLAIDAREAGRLLSLHPETVARMARRGELPHFKAGRSVRFSVAALTEWLQQQSSGGVLT